MPNAALERVRREIVECRACPRLVAHREATANAPPRRFRGQTYWARPVPGFGDAKARLLVVGLAPAAHGGNRTGRIFTGDSSGDFLFAALHRAGLANQALSVGKGDGLSLQDTYIGAAARCAPPDNRPSPQELERCRPYLVRELMALDRLAVVLALGAIAWDAVLRAFQDLGVQIVKPRPLFSHGALLRVATEAGRRVLLGSYHVSQQNTNTGRLTPRMLDDVLARARREMEAACAG